MTERKYKRAEFEAELHDIRKWTDAAYSPRSKEAAESAERRIMQWFDDVQLNLGEVGALRTNLTAMTTRMVEQKVRAEEAEQRIWHLERQLAAVRVENNELDSERNDEDE